MMSLTSNIHIEETSNMSDPINKCKAQETAACCCVDVGTVIDNTDCTASYRYVFATQREAEDALVSLISKARSIESEPCEIKSNIKSITEGVQLEADFTFSCQAETLIFQLALR